MGIGCESWMGVCHQRRRAKPDSETMGKMSRDIYCDLDGLCETEDDVEGGIELGAAWTWCVLAGGLIRVERAAASRSLRRRASSHSLQVRSNDQNKV